MSLAPRPKKRKCKACATYFVPWLTSLQPGCSYACLAAIGAQRRATAERTALRERKRETRAALEAIRPRPKWLADAQRWCNAYIRERDKARACISCGTWDAMQWDAGHYRSVGAFPELRFDERNIHRQCSVCNDHKASTDTDYRRHLIIKIGLAGVEALEGPHAPAKWSIEEIKAIRDDYKARLRALLKEQKCSTI